MRSSDLGLQSAAVGVDGIAVRRRTPVLLRHHQHHTGLLAAPRGDDQNERKGYGNSGETPEGGAAGTPGMTRERALCWNDTALRGHWRVGAGCQQTCRLGAPCGADGSPGHLLTLLGKERRGNDPDSTPKAPMHSWQRPPEAGSLPSINSAVREESRLFATTQSDQDRRCCMGTACSVAVVFTGDPAQQEELVGREVRRLSLAPARSGLRRWGARSFLPFGRTVGYLEPCARRDGPFGAQLVAAAQVDRRHREWSWVRWPASCPDQASIYRQAGWKA